jgi:hypothetical protein
MRQHPGRVTSEHEYAKNNVRKTPTRRSRGDLPRATGEVKGCSRGIAGQSLGGGAGFGGGMGGGGMFRVRDCSRLAVTRVGNHRMTSRCSSERASAAVDRRGEGVAEAKIGQPARVVRSGNWSPNL